MNSFQKFLSKFLCVIIIFSGVVGESERAWGAQATITKKQALDHLVTFFAEMNIPISYIQPVVTSLNTLFGSSSSIPMPSFQNFIISLPSLLRILGFDLILNYGVGIQPPSDARDVLEENISSTALVN